MRAEFGERLAVTVKGQHRRQASPEPKNDERPARLPAGLVPAFAIEPLSLEIHPIGLLLLSGGRPKPGDSSEFCCAGVLLAEIRCVQELMGQNLGRQQITRVAAEVIPC